MSKKEYIIEEKYYKIWLTLIENFGIKRYLNLINKFKKNSEIFKANENELKNVNLIDKKICQNILDQEIRKKAKIFLNYMELNQIDIISIMDKEYPSLLKQIYSPPVCLYIMGNKKSLNELSISIVGSRQCSDYGKSITQKLAFDLAKSKVNIVSGLAKGIDSFAHLGAIFAKEKTIAVLGNGLNEIYPKENTYLAKKILENNGAIITEIPLNKKIEKINFPARNRIISGLSQGTVVIEAREKSGALITCDFALEQGRNVFVVPRKY